MNRFRVGSWIVATTLAAFVAEPAPAQSFVFGGVSDGGEALSDPLLGDWQGRWTGKGQVFEDNPLLVAQVIPRGKGQYQINLLPEFDQRCPAYLTLTAAMVDGEVQFEQDGWTATITADRFAGSGLVKGLLGTFELEKVTRLPPSLGAKPPEGAVVLFDGSGFEHWEPVFRGKGAGGVNWTLQDGAMRIRPDRDAHRHSLRTRERFGDLQLHIEFHLPLLPGNQGQSRANSGVSIGGLELQVLDSYGLPGYYNECGAFYKRAAPTVNMCAPPLQWQTYDVTFRAPRYDDEGRMTEPATYTVLHNGVLIHKQRELTRKHATDFDEVAEPRFQPSTISLQNHGNAVGYRNIWVVAGD
jgi:hypothetical protein